MKPWQNRPVVVANLLNPAFCGALLASCIKSYCKEKDNNPFPFVLSFLVLPIVLHKNTRALLPKNSRKSLHEWIQDNASIKIGFAERCHQMNQFTREALMFLLNQKTIKLNEKGDIFITKFNIGANKRFDEEINECFSKSELIGKLFAKAGNTLTIFTFWGVKP